MIYLCAVFFLLRIVLIFLSWILVRGGNYYSEKLACFECGFISFLGHSGSFSLHFFIITILFLIFDVEIVLILPLPILFGKILLGVETYLVGGFIFAVLGGLYFEWRYGRLEWIY